MLIKKNIKRIVLDIVFASLMLTGVLMAFGAGKPQEARACEASEGCWPPVKCTWGTCFSDNWFCGSTCGPGKSCDIHTGTCSFDPIGGGNEFCTCVYCFPTTWCN
jgi:hypothetical protein